MKEKEHLFSLGEILSITTGRPLCVCTYNIMKFLVRGELFTYRLAQARAECRAYLLREHPELNNSEMDVALAILDAFLEGTTDKSNREEIAIAWLSDQAKKYGKMLAITQLPVSVCVDKGRSFSVLRLRD